LAVDNTAAADLLAIIKRSGDLTVPELVARSRGEPARLVESLEQLHAAGFVSVEPRSALAELHAFAEDITHQMGTRPAIDQRVEFLNKTSSRDSISRHTILSVK
jgi:hypothetical protein